MRFLTLLVLSFFLATSAYAQSLQDVRDPETGEPVPQGFEAFPVDYDSEARSGGFELTPIQHVAEGSTKLVRRRDDGILFQNGAYLITGEILHTQPDTASVEEFDRYLLEAQPADVVIQNDIAYVALRKNKGLLILDLSNPLDIQMVGQLEGEDLLAVDVQGDYAFVGRGTSGIGVYDISDPANPSLVHTSDTPGSANGIEVVGSTMYVADGNNNSGPDFRVYDITDPTNPQFQGDLEAGDFVTYVTAAPANSAIMLLAGGFGLKIVDVSDPLNPTEISTLSMGGDTTYEIATTLSTDPIFVAGLAGVFSVDISDPAMPEIDRSYTDVGQGLSVAVHETHELALLGDRFLGLRITDAADTGGSDLPAIGLYENAGFSHKAFFFGDELYVTDLSGRLRILDVSDVHNVVAEIARVNDVPPNTQEVHVESDIAYVSDSDFGGTGLTMLDVADPSDPQIIGGWNSGNQAFGMDLVGNILYLANGFSGIVALDVSDPSNVQELGSFPMGSNTVDVVVDSAAAVAYAVNFGAGMYSIDVSDPANMQQLDAETGWGFLNAIDFNDPEFGDSQLGMLVADGQEGLRFVDSAVPTALETIYTLPTLSQARDISSAYTLIPTWGGPYLSGAAVADDFYGLREFTVEGESAFLESADRGIGTDYHYFQHVVALAAGETGVYFAEGPIGTEIESIPEQVGLSIQSVYPNPLRETGSIRIVLQDASSISFTAYDLLGRRVATLAEGVRSAGSHEVVFDASDLPSGVYILRLQAGNQVATMKVSVVR